MKKQKILTPKVKRQLEVLSKYYEIDQENRLITLELTYDKVSDMLEDGVVSTKKAIFKQEILRHVSDILDTFPGEFQVNLEFKINDYEEYDPQEIVDSFKDSLEMFHYGIQREKSNRLFKAVILALVCVGILFLRKFFNTHGLLDTENLLYEMLDITAWVFLWQGVTVLFLMPNEYREISFKILTRLNIVSLYKKDKLLIEISQDDIQRNWVQISRAEKNARQFMIIAGAFTFAAGIISLVDGIVDFASQEFSVISLITFLFSLLVSGLVSILGGIGAISVYRDKGPFQKLVPFCAYFYLIASILLIAFVAAFSIEIGSVSIFFGMLATFLVFIVSSVVYFISYLILRHVRKVALKKNA